MQKYQVEFDDNCYRWYQNGQLHRTEGPAIEFISGDRVWYQNGQLHRTDGPAVEHSNGGREWFQNGQLHRTDGPAVEHSNGDREWYQNGQIHRTDGPAVEYKRPETRRWYLHGQELTEQEFVKRTAPAREMTISEISAALGMKSRSEHDEPENSHEENEMINIDFQENYTQYKIASGKYSDASVAADAEIIYAVVVNYDTGDSFSQSPDQLCFCAAFSDKTKAEALALAIAEDNDTNPEYDFKKNGNKINYIDDFGNNVVCSTSTWKGYFERFNFVEVVRSHKIGSLNSKIRYR